MRIIIHDVESVVPRGKMYSAEIIEVAALAVDMEEDRLHVRDGFHAYVRPLHVHSLPIVTAQFTGIQPETIAAADPFPSVMESFTAWLGNEEYYLCSWSLSDRDYFIADCRQHHLSTDWIRNYNDIQRWYGRIRGETKRRAGLSRAMEQLGLPPIGSAHSAMADAVNTFRILTRIYQPNHPVFALERNDCSGIVHAEVVYQDDVDDADDPMATSPFARLKDFLSETSSQ